MRDAETILLGTGASVDQVDKTLQAVLGVDGRPENLAIYYQVGDGDLVMLDIEASEEPALNDGFEHALLVWNLAEPKAEADGSRQRATARRVYDLLVDGTTWDLRLCRGEWGPTVAHRGPIRV